MTNTPTYRDYDSGDVSPLTQASDPKWVESALRYWQEQKSKHPHTQLVQWNLDHVEQWARQLGIEV